MTSIINAATSGGLISTADTSGVLQLQTASTTALTINASQNVGIGTTSPTSKLDVTGTINNTGGVSFGGSDSSSASGQIKYLTGNGLTIYSKTGSTNDFSLLGAAGNGIMRIPTGTVNLNFPQAGVTFNAFGIGLGAANPSSGTGITFPATQSASSDANTLDDYEEGTWTPTIEGTTTAGTASYGARSGQYTKIGRQVTVITYISWSSGTGTGNLRVSGLPFTNNSGSVYGAITLSEFDNIAMTANYYPNAYFEQGNTRIILEQSPTGGGTTIGVPYDGAGAFILTGTYFV